MMLKPKVLVISSENQLAFHKDGANPFLDDLTAIFTWIKQLEQIRKCPGV